MFTCPCDDKPEDQREGAWSGTFKYTRLPHCQYKNPDARSYLPLPRFADGFGGWSGSRVLVLYDMQHAYNQHKSGGQYTPCRAVSHSAQVPGLNILAPRGCPSCHVMRALLEDAIFVKAVNGGGGVGVRFSRNGKKSTSTSCQAPTAYSRAADRNRMQKCCAAKS
jgi:hypothetical protein